MYKMERNYSKISIKGQLTIPKEFLKNLNLSAGDEVILFLDENSIVIRPKATLLGMLRGLLKEEIDMEKAISFIQSVRKNWRL